MLVYNVSFSIYSLISICLAIRSSIYLPIVSLSLSTHTWVYVYAQVCISIQYVYMSMQRKINGF